MLFQVAEQVLPQRIKNGLLRYCPTMDLVAVATEDEQVQVFRLNGQRVFTAAKKDEDAVVRAVCWKPNGRVLIIAYEGGLLSLVSTHTGKVISHIHSASLGSSLVSCLGWGVNFTEPSAAKQLLESGKTKPGAGVAAKKAVQRGGLLEEAVVKGLQALEIEVPLDLPADLRNLDIESSLPKLSVLPSSASTDDAFTTRASVDTIFHTARKDSNESADIVLVGAEDGTIYLSIYDFFELGSLDELKKSGHGKVVWHCSHPYSSTHGLMLASNGTSSSLSFVPLDLKLIPDTGKYLSLLASKSGQIQNIVRYIKSAIAQIAADFKTSQELPQRFIRNAEEDLEEKEHTSFTNAMFHLAATGNCSPVLKDWLIDQLGERGHKRWEKAAVSGYEGVCRYTLQNLIPALDRFMVLVSRLRGLSRFFESSAALGLSTVDLDLVMDTASCLKFMAHIVLKSANAELRGYTAFANWMKLEIEVQNTELTSTAVDDFPPKYAALDYPTIFEYIQDGLQHSGISDLCSDAGVAATSVELLKQTGSIYEDFKKLIKGNAKGVTRPSLAAVLDRLDQQCQGIFSDIAGALRRKVRFGSSIVVETKDVNCFDTTMTVDATDVDDNSCCAIVASTLKGQPAINIRKINISITNGISSMESVEAAHFILPAQRTIEDIKFIDSKTLIVVLAGTGRDLPCIASLSIEPVPEGETGSRFNTVSLQNLSKDTGPALDLSKETILQEHIIHTFDDKVALNPARVEVHGRKGRRALCILSADRVRYRVFALDTASNEAAEADDTEDDMDVERD